jgi:hypothetical protein
MTQDPIGLEGGVNQYAFTGNDPANNSDPSGLLLGDDCWSFFDITLGESGGIRVVCRQSSLAGTLSDLIWRAEHSAAGWSTAGTPGGVLGGFGLGPTVSGGSSGYTFGGPPAGGPSAKPTKPLPQIMIITGEQEYFVGCDIQHVNWRQPSVTNPQTGASYGAARYRITLTGILLADNTERANGTVRFDKALPGWPRSVNLTGWVNCETGAYQFTSKRYWVFTF